MNELVTLRSFNNSVEFEMAKSYLESFEIECFAQDEILNRTYFSVNGGAKLQVREEQAAQAIKLLLEGGYLTKEDFEPSPEIKWVEKILRFFKRK